MNLPHRSKSRKRPAFTLVELVIVIGIILILASMLLAGVFRAMAMAKRTQNTNDITQLSTAITGGFLQAYNTGGPFPSRIHLLNNCSNYVLTLNANGQPNNQLDFDSVTFLQKMFPKANFTSGTYLWSAAPGASGDVTLEGEECLVFFLGGIPSVDSNGNPVVTGFSTNQTNPTWHVMNPSNPGTTKGPFFTFKSERLITGPHTGFFVYQDIYGKNQPYAYFSSYTCFGQKANNYNRYVNFGATTSDCASLTLTNTSGTTASLWPYAQGARTSSSTAPDFIYLNPSSFQIISAGADGVWGNGTDCTQKSPPFWTPQTADQSLASTGGGLDDQGNFYGQLLGDTP